MKLESYKQNTISTYVKVHLANKDSGWVPGARVMHIVDRDAYGIIVSVTSEEITVMWSTPPVDFSSYSSMVTPLIRRVDWQKLGRDMIRIEPMTSGALPVYEAPKKDGKK